MYSACRKSALLMRFYGKGLILLGLMGKTKEEKVVFWAIWVSKRQHGNDDLKKVLLAFVIVHTVLMQI